MTTEELQRRALELGLAALGVCEAEPYTTTERAIAERSERRLFADLKFTMAQPEVSCHPERVLEGAVSVISVALDYWAPEPAVDAAHDEPRGVIARYTRSDSYAALKERLDVLAGVLEEAGHEARVLVDANHHVDREAAARSGVGFYGKHTNLITRRHGSWVVLGTIITSAPLDPTEPMRPGCGDCTACIDACPTNAIIDDGGVLDINECITYWTQSRHIVPEPVRDAMGTRIYGCDICQEVCPWNVGSEKRHRADGTAAHSIDNAMPRLAEWLTAPAPELNERYERFFIPRRDVRYLRRNALIAMGHAGRDRDVPVIAPFLAGDDAMLNEHAAWALRKIGSPAALAALDHASTGDIDTV